MPLGKSIEVTGEAYTDEVRRFYVTAKGSWSTITPDEFELIRVVAENHWASQLSGVEYPWLCWNVNDAWCLVQQRMVRSVGWTPVVGFDPRVGPPPLVDGAILVDFNEGLDLPTMSMMFPLELVFLFAPRLAFWHSDLLVREPLFRQLAEGFRELPDGETAAVDVRARWHRRIRGEYGRFWELIGCTTRAASLDQFQNGAGWWRKHSAHPNCPNGKLGAKRSKYFYDHGVGILIWQRHHGGVVRPINAKPIEEGHCSRIGNKNYQSVSPNDHRRDLSKDLVNNYKLDDVCRKLQLSQFLAG